MTPSDIVQELCEFLRLSRPPTEFEQWLYDTPGLDELLGSDRYLNAINTDFRDQRAVSDLRFGLQRWLNETSPPKCLCLLWPDSYSCVFGSESYRYIPDQFEVLKDRTPWLQLARCRGCGQSWYVATDTVDDDLYFVRLTDSATSDILNHNVWPHHFDKLQNVWLEPHE
jgi:hypothetical protein